MNASWMDSFRLRVRGLYDYDGTGFCHGGIGMDKN